MQAIPQRDYVRITNPVDNWTVGHIYIPEPNYSGMQNGLTIQSSFRSNRANPGNPHSCVNVDVNQNPVCNVFSSTDNPFFPYSQEPHK